MTNHIMDTPKIPTRNPLWIINCLSPNFKDDANLFIFPDSMLFYICTRAHKVKHVMVYNADAERYVYNLKLTWIPQFQVSHLLRKKRNKFPPNSSPIAFTKSFREGCLPDCILVSHVCQKKLDICHVIFHAHIHMIFGFLGRTNKYAVLSNCLCLI